MKNFIGQDGFVWWIGEVVDIDDPLSLGRCRVRIFGYHGEERDIPNDDLPWAVAIHSLNTPNLYGTPRVGYFVFGFFLDASSAQEPAMLGYFPGIPEVGTRNFANISSKEDVVLDINGAKIEITNSGEIFFSSKNVDRISLETIVAKIDDAQKHANGAFDKANTATENVATLNTKTNVIYSFANTTFEVTNVSYETANQAFVVANTSYQTANDAYETANLVFNQANGAFDKANTSLAISFVL